MPALNDQFDYSGTKVYKNDLNAGQTSLFYYCDDWCLADPYVTSNAVYLLTCNRDSENKIIALSPDGTKTHEIPFDSYASTVVLYSDRYFYCIGGLAPYGKHNLHTNHWVFPKHYDHIYLKTILLGVLSCSLMGWIENGVSPLKRIERKSKKKKEAV